VTLPQGRVFVRFLTVNVLNTGLYYLLYLLLLRVMPYVAANLVALAVAVVLAYLMNARWAFQVGMTGRSMVMFVASNLTTTGLRTLVLWALVEFVGLTEQLSPLLATAVTLPAAFMLTRWAMRSGGGSEPAVRVAAGRHPTAAGGPAPAVWVSRPAAGRPQG
jgi:putative flippase GtrA